MFWKINVRKPRNLLWPVGKILDYYGLGTHSTQHMHCFSCCRWFDGRRGRKDTLKECRVGSLQQNYCRRKTQRSHAQSLERTPLHQSRTELDSYGTENQPLSSHLPRMRNSIFSDADVRHHKSEQAQSSDSFLKREQLDACFMCCYDDTE